MQANHCLLYPPYRSTATSPPYHPILDLAAVNAPALKWDEIWCPWWCGG